MDSPAGPLVPLRIRLPYAAEAEFIARYGMNLSRGGMFVATRSLKAEGTALEIEVVLQGGVVLLRGEAVVVKTLVDEGGARSGMTLRFTRLDAASRALVERVVAARAVPSGQGKRSGGATPATGPAFVPRTISRELPAADVSARSKTSQAPSHAPTQSAAVTSSRAPAQSAADLGSPGSPEATQPPPASAESNDSAKVPRPATAMSTGLAHPLELPRSTGPNTALSEPVLGIVLTGTTLDVVGGPVGAGGFSLHGWPLSAAFVDDRWYLGPDALAHGGESLFTPRTGGGNAGPLVVNGATVDRTLLAANLFAAVRTRAEATLGRAVQHAVLAVPFALSYADRALLTEAARLAGLRPLQVIHAASAACAWFARGRGLARKRVLVLHAAPHLFEASVIQVTGDDHEVIRVRGIACSTDAEPSDQAIADITRDTLAAAGIDAGAVDEIIRFGDASALSRCAGPLEQFLGRSLSDPLPADAAVQGAALLARSHVELARGKRGGSVFEVLTSPVSLVQRDGTLRRVLEIGTRLPAEKTLGITLAASELLTLIVCEGDTARCEDAHVLGAANVESGPLGGELTVHLAVDRTGLISLSTAMGTARVQPQALTPPTQLAAVLPLTLPAEPAKRSGFLRGLVQKLGKG